MLVVVRLVAVGLSALIAGMSGGCALRESDGAPLTADMPLHLEDHLDAATVEGSLSPEGPPKTLEWRFDAEQPDWKAARPANTTMGAPVLTWTGKALRVTLGERTRQPSGHLGGGIYVDLPGRARSDWGRVLVRARSDGPVGFLDVGFSLNRRRGPQITCACPFDDVGDGAPLVRDGTIQTYAFDTSAPRRGSRGAWQVLGLSFSASREAGPGSIDLLSVSLRPLDELFRDPPYGRRTIVDADRRRRVLYVHTPARIAYHVRVPQGGRLDLRTGVVSGRDPVTFSVDAQRGRTAAETLLEVRHDDRGRSALHSVDLDRFAGQAITLTLAARSDEPGAVGFWAAPTVSGSRQSAERPNILFYVIDGGGADQMSVYGYNRRTTPVLERLAREGALFEHAYSNAPWTQPSTRSFMTSLQSSVVAPDVAGMFQPLPEGARTMAERFHDAGYATGAFVSNPYAGSLSQLERGLDELADTDVEVDSASSVDLHAAFLAWLDAVPGRPYWTHIQTTEVHPPRTPVPPFAGLFAPPAVVGQLKAWDDALRRWRRAHVRATGVEQQRRQWAEAGVDRVRYYDAMRAVYDETLAHQDAQLGRLIERLKDRGEWENTLLVVAADHSVWALAGEDFILGVHDSLPAWNDPEAPPILRSSVSRVPLLLVWPERIPGGQRLRQPVSMIDVLPTLLDLAGLPPPDVMQGQSLAPLLLNRPGWTPRPVILDGFDRNRDGALQGQIEIVDGHWGASLRIGPTSPSSVRPAALLLFDVWEDPLALKPLNDQRPELVKKYTALLEKQWQSHQLLATRFKPGGAVELTPQQLERLRTLGYIR